MHCRPTFADLGSNKVSSSSSSCLFMILRRWFSSNLGDKNNAMSVQKQTHVFFLVPIEHNAVVVLLMLLFMLSLSVLSSSVQQLPSLTY